MTEPGNITRARIVATERLIAPIEVRQQVRSHLVMQERFQPPP